MSSQTQSIQLLLKSFPARPFDQKGLDDKVAQEVQKFQSKSSQENTRSQWEVALKNEVFALAATEGIALKEKSTTYYDGLRDRLDLVLTFTEQDACETTFPFTVLQDLLETQTITSCSHIFSWIEMRATRLTKGMVPQKGKALVLLRTLNDLLRRLSKMGSTTMFCGRILTFLSGVFPLGERSGVNLRGEYGPMWEGVMELESEDVDMKDDPVMASTSGDKMEVDEAKGNDDAKKQMAESKGEKDGFYKTFWSLQLPFSRPPLFASPNTFNEFKEAVDKVLPVIKEATTKERAMMGNRSSAGPSGILKRKREAEPGEETNSSDYFFAKFLTSPDLLTLEIADTHFRRQVLFQLLILLNHLLSFTKSAKATWATSRNRSLQMDFTLEPAEAQWVQDTIVKASAELRSTAPNGPIFADTVNVILDREKNWVKWKNDLSAVPSPVPPAASAPVVAAPAPSSNPAPAPSPAPAPPTDEQIIKFEENKQRWSWLALRTARDQHLQHFGKIGTGDVALLAQEIEAEKEREKKEREREKEREKAQKAEEIRVLVTGGAGYIGSHVIYALQETRRYKVISIDNHHNSFPASLTRVTQIARDALPENGTEADKDSAEIEALQCELTSPEQIRAVFEKYGKGGIWGVVHIAAYKAVGESVEIPLTYYANNVAATLSLLQIMSEYDCTRIVYSSSATVYGTPPIIPIPETTRLKADSPYGKTKVMSETIIDDLCHAEPHRWRGISLRYFNPAGAHPSGLIGEDPRGRPGNLLPLLAHMAIGRVKDATLKVFGNDYPTPDGTCVRDYLHVLDLASGHLLALDALAPESKVFDNCPDEARYKAYNLGKGRGMSVLQIVEAMRKATGFDYKYEIIGRRRGDVPDLTADPALAEKELGFKAPQTLEVMCRDLWNWQTKNPQGYATQQ
ncbi:hypothetical protein HYDPIDRAFT_86611 [Hydnomerulius pinastri MD-312]|nr:hypothetical protein HYDPIDRAFT_86611 [Hydnomerulius pinastri MD-312]